MKQRNLARLKWLDSNERVDADVFHKTGQLSQKRRAAPPQTSRHTRCNKNSPPRAVLATNVEIGRVGVRLSKCFHRLAGGAGGRSEGAVIGDNLDISGSLPVERSEPPSSYTFAK